MREHVTLPVLVKLDNIACLNFKVKVGELKWFRQAGCRGH